MLHGFTEYLRSPLEFTESLQLISLPTKVGISLSTILLLLIDMRYQQFIVRAKDVQSAYRGCVLAAIALLCLAFLPSSVVIAALKAGMLPTGIDGKETLPFILSSIGGGTNTPFGILLMASLLVPALGVGSSTLRVQSKIILDFNILPTFPLNRLLVTGTNALLGLIVAFKGGEIVSLIVSFYAAYVGAVFIPFVAYVVGQLGGYKFSQVSVRLSLFLGGSASVSMLILSFINPSLAIYDNVELNILQIGILFGVLSLFVGQVLEKYSLMSKQREET